MNDDSAVGGIVNNKPKVNKGLVVLLCILLVTIVGLSIGLVIVKNNEVEKEQLVDGKSVSIEVEITDGMSIEEKTARYQAAINNQTQSAEKAALYREKIILMKNEMRDTGNNYCDQIVVDLEELEKILTWDEYVDIIQKEDIPCVSVMDADEVDVEVSDGNE